MASILALAAAFLFALVTDKDWVRHGVAVIGWVSPGELRVFADGERAQAAAWLAE